MWWLMMAQLAGAAPTLDASTAPGEVILEVEEQLAKKRVKDRETLVLVQADAWIRGAADESFRRNRDDWREKLIAAVEQVAAPMPGEPGKDSFEAICSRALDVLAAHQVPPTQAEAFMAQVSQSARLAEHCGGMGPWTWHAALQAERQDWTMMLRALGGGYRSHLSGAGAPSVEVSLKAFALVEQMRGVRLNDAQVKELASIVVAARDALALDAQQLPQSAKLRDLRRRILFSELQLVKAHPEGSDAVMSRAISELERNVLDDVLMLEMAFAYEELERWEPSLQMLQMAVQAAPTRARNRHALGVWFLNDGALATHASQVDPSEEGRAAALQAAQGSLLQAQLHLNAAQQLDPRAAQTCNALAEVHRLMGDEEGARQWASQAKALGE